MRDVDYKVFDDIMSTCPRFGLVNYILTTTKGTRFDFRHRPWAMELYRDRSDKICWQSCVQIGKTEYALADLQQHAMRKRAVMYVLPTANLRDRFVPRRVFRQIESTPLLRANFGKRGSHAKASEMKSQIVLFGADVRFAAMNIALDFHEYPADHLIFDEYDRCLEVGASSLGLAHSRQEASTNPTESAVSTPSQEGEGINGLYLLSDRKVWMIKCSHCNHWQNPTFFGNAIRQTDEGRYALRDTERTVIMPDGSRDAAIHCAKCDKPIDRLSAGQWVAEFPDSEWSGYQCSQVFAKPGPPAVILKMFDDFVRARYNQTLEQTFYNDRLGLPYAGEGAKFTDDILSACVEHEYKMPLSAEGTIAGVDVGGVLHVHIEKVVNGLRRKVFIGVAKDWDDLHVLCARYKVRRGVIDAMPEQHACEQFCRAHTGWYRCWYSLPDTNPEPKLVDHASRTVKVKRTESLDQSFAHYCEGRVILPVDWKSVDGGDFKAQMQAATRIKQEKVDQKGNRSIVYVWSEGTKADHHQHADNYARIASSLYAQVAMAVV